MRLPLDILKSAIRPLGDFPDRGKAVKFYKPALFLRALQGHYIPEDAFPLILSFFPLSRIVDIDCGHWIVQEEPEKVRECMLMTSSFNLKVYCNYELTFYNRRGRLLTE